MPIPGAPPASPAASASGRSARPSTSSGPPAVAPLAAALPGRLATSNEVSASRKLPDLAPNGPFLLSHHYKSWELVEEGLEGPTWLPVLKVFSLEGGRNGNRTTEGGIDFDPALLRFQKQGWKFIPEDPPYRYVVQGSRGEVHLQVWDRVVVYADGSYDRAWDHVGYNRWRLKLVEDGAVPGPRESVVAKLMGRLRTRITRNSAQIHIPARREAQDAYEERLAKMEDARQPAPIDPGKALAAENERLKQELARLQREHTPPPPPSAGRKTTLPPEAEAP